MRLAAHSLREATAPKETDANSRGTPVSDPAERRERGDRYAAEGHAEDYSRENIAQKMHAKDDAREGDAQSKEEEGAFHSGIEITQHERDRKRRHSVTGRKGKLIRRQNF